MRLIEQSIRRAQDFKMQSLAVIVNALADLDIANPTLLEVVKQILLRKIDVLSTTALSEVPAAGKHKPAMPDASQLSPQDCAMFMTAYTRNKQFDAVDLLQSLENSFLLRIDEANGPTLATMFNSHAAWCHHVVDQSIIKGE